MTDSTLTYETARGVGMQANAVTVTANSGAFPTAFSNNTVTGAQNEYMVVIDVTLTKDRTKLIEALKRLLKAIDEDVTNFGN